MHPRSHLALAALWGLLAGSSLTASDTLAAARLYQEGSLAAREQRFTTAATQFQAAAAAHPALAAQGYYNAACAFARAGQTRAALEALARSAARGYRDRVGMASDPDLDSLAGQPRWASLLRQVEANDRRFRRDHDDPARARLVTADLGRLRATLGEPFPAQTQDARMARVADLYLHPGSPGLVDFFALGKIQDLDRLAGTFGALPRFFGSLGALEAAIDAQRPAILAALARMKALYPPTFFPQVSFVVGHFRSGGTATANGLVIGAEVYCRAPGVDLGEFGPRDLELFRPVEELPSVVVHELVHFQQTGGGTPSLLRQALVEGTADFIATLVCPDLPEPAYRTWGDAHEREVWARFVQAMDGTDCRDWIANNDRARPDWPAALGYYVGFRIARAYHAQAADKRAALADLLRLRDPKALLKASGYDPSR